MTFRRPANIADLDITMLKVFYAITHVIFLAVWVVASLFSKGTIDDMEMVPEEEEDYLEMQAAADAKIDHESTAIE